jgi:structural maintenance of chromosomes protein 6
LQNIQRTYKFIKQKELALPDLKTAFKEAKVRFEEANKAREQKKKVEDLKKELAWAHVSDKQRVSSRSNDGFMPV